MLFSVFKVLYHEHPFRIFSCYVSRAVVSWTYPSVAIRHL